MPYASRNPFYRYDVNINPELKRILFDNGMQAQLSQTATGNYQLIVLGHDSPALTYELNERQLKALTEGGTNGRNKKAYNTFTDIVKNDFYLPDNYVSAANARGTVNLGLHGYRVRTGYPFYSPFSRHTRGWGGDYLRFSPHPIDGYHLRRIGGRTFLAGTTMVPDRPDGSRRPGELNAGGYGFYYKGSHQKATQEALDSLAVSKLSPLQAPKRPQGEAKPLKDALPGKNDAVYFTNEKWQEVLSSHGILIQDANEKHGKRVVIQAGPTRVDTGYSLTDKEYAALTNNKVEGKNGVSIQKRLDILNNIIGDDYNGKITREMLNSKELISIDFKPEVKAVLEAKFIERDKQIEEQQKLISARKIERNVEEAKDLAIAQKENAVNGKNISLIMPGMVWSAEANGKGRAVVIEEINVEKVGEKYFMNAKINGVDVSHEISQKEYNKFLAVDDKARLELFDEKFKEIEMRKANKYDNILLQGQMLGDKYITADTINKHNALTNSVDGNALAELNEKKGFYREGKDGREVNVGKISVEKDPLHEGQYKMTAVINGQAITHEISQKEYDKFLAVDDFHRMKLFSKIFDEVDMKTRPGMGTNVGAAILAAVTAATDLMLAPAHIMHPRPEVYIEHQHRINPAEMSAIAFETGMNGQQNDETYSQSRGV